MWPVTNSFLQAIRSSHAIEIRGTVYFDGAVVEQNVRIVEGSVRADGRSSVRRSISGLKVVSASGTTSALREVFDTGGAEILLERGVRYPTGRIELVPVGRFRVDVVEDEIAQEGVVSVTGGDLSARVIDDRFQAPRRSTDGLTTQAMIERLIQESIPSAFLLNSVENVGEVGGGVVWERERWDACLSLATSIGGELYAAPDGDFVLRAARTLSDPPDWTVSAGASGALIGGARRSTREGVANSIVASSAATDGTTPVYAVAEDTDPASATYVGGPYGRVTYFYTSPLLGTTTQCQAAADAILQRTLGRRSSLAIESLVNPALEVGDRIDVLLPDGSVQRHLVDAFDLPLDPSEAMRIETRVADLTTEG